MKPSMLIGCEHSGTVREAMREQGIDAYSCDLLPADDGSPFHIQGDVRDAMRSRDWDGFGLHPDCTFTTVAGIHWNNRGRGWEKTDQAVAVAKELIALCGSRPFYLEQPVCILSTCIRQPDQIVQPYRFGHDASKQTCLWLQGFPTLRDLPMDEWVKPRWVCKVCKRVSTDEDAMNWKDQKGHPRCHHCSGTPRLLPRWGNQTDSGQNKLPPSPDRWKLRSKTYPGIAQAMAKQWSKYL